MMRNAQISALEQHFDVRLGTRGAFANASPCRPEVAEDPDNLVVYGGSGKAAKDAFNNIVNIESLENDETLLVQSGSLW